MRRLTVLFISALVLILVSIFWVALRTDKRANTHGHVRQAFFKHVGSMILIQEDNVGSPAAASSALSILYPKANELCLRFLDENNLSEFSQSSNLKEVVLFADDGVGFVANKVDVSKPQSTEHLLAGQEYKDLKGKGLLLRTIAITLNPLDFTTPTVLKTVRFTFADGLAEDYPIGEIKITTVQLKELSLLEQINIQLFKRIRSSFPSELQKFKINAIPFGLCYTCLALRIPLEEVGLGSSVELGGASLSWFNGDKIIGFALDLDGIWLDWSNPVYAHDMRLRPAVSKAVLQTYSEEKGKEDSDLPSADDFFRRLNNLVMSSGYPKGILSIDDEYIDDEHNNMDPEIYLPNPYYLWKTKDTTMSSQISIVDLKLYNDFDGKKALEAWIPVYYLPGVDHTNTFKFVQPIITVASADGSRVAKKMPKLVIDPPTRYDNFAQLLEEQNP